MILVDVQVPVLNQVYDFELEEDVQVGILLEDILALVSQRAGVSCGEGKGMLLYAMEQERILKKENTLKQQMISDGDRLILI